MSEILRNEKIEILIVDDSPILVDFLTNLFLSREGFYTRSALDGQEMFELLESGYRPDLILLDIFLPGKDGFELCKELKKQSKFYDIPVIFMTSKEGDDYISHSFKAGGVDYITKPINKYEIINRVKLQVKQSFLISHLKKTSEKLQYEIREKNSVEKLLKESYDKSHHHGTKLLEINKNLQHEVVKRKIMEKKLADINKEMELEKRKVEILNQNLIEEQEVAKKIFDKILDKGCLRTSSYIQYHISPVSTFNGDLIFADMFNEKILNFVLGDFTGHGLPAAIGVIPFSKVFFGMAKKGHNIENIIVEANQELKEVLPTNIFCAASFLQVDKERKVFKIWVGCLPDVFLLNKDMEIIKFFNSVNVPLGILDKSSFDNSFIEYSYSEGDSLLFYTDGVIEAHNDLEENFGMERFKSLFPISSESPLEYIVEKVMDFRGSLEQQDDLTLARVML